MDWTDNLSFLEGVDASLYPAALEEGSDHDCSINYAYPDIPAHDGFPVNAALHHTDRIESNHHQAYSSALDMFDNSNALPIATQVWTLPDLGTDQTRVGGIDDLTTSLLRLVRGLLNHQVAMEAQLTALKAGMPCLHVNPVFAPDLSAPTAMQDAEYEMPGLTDITSQETESTAQTFSLPALDEPAFPPKTSANRDKDRDRDINTILNFHDRLRSIVDATPPRTPCPSASTTDTDSISPTPTPTPTPHLASPFSVSMRPPQLTGRIQTQPTSSSRIHKLRKHQPIRHRHRHQKEMEFKFLRPVLTESADGRRRIVHVA